jgi:hypothetical protein
MDLQFGIFCAEWTQSAQSDNASITPSQAAVASKRHYITKVTASFSIAPTGRKLLTIQDGATILARLYIDTANVDLIFNPPLRCSVNSAAQCSLAASGTAGTLGAASIHGFTRP